MPRISEQVVHMPASGIRAITNRALAMTSVIRLEIGEPNFSTPEHIVEAANRAARDGFTRYTETQGLVSLREAWCERLARVNGCRISPDQAIVSAGAVSGLYATFAALLDLGDEILIPDPGWPNWTMMAALVGARVVGYPSRAADGWQPDLSRLEALVTPRTRALLINSPANPTGAVLPAETIAWMAEFARRHDLWLISDECYDAIVFEGNHVGAAPFDSDARTVTIVSCSKTFAMTGWRVGCVAAPRNVAPLIAKVQQATLGSVCAVAQKAAEAALTGPQDCVAHMRTAYQERRDQAKRILENLGVPMLSPGGAFYTMIDLSTMIQDGVNFANRLLERYKVAVAPGEAFGPGGNRSVRVALCVSEEALGRGLPLLIEAARE